FCHAYILSGLADQVLVADGGSDDDTVAIAEGLSGVKVAEYSGQVFGVSGSNWRNPHGEHINFLIDWASAEGADWIIFDDCDGVPNRLLQKRGREYLEESNCGYALAVRIYFWGSDQWFPELSKDRAGSWMAGLWAWRANKDLRADEANPWKHGFNRLFPLGVSDKDVLGILPPAALIHRPWPTEEKAQEKLEFYKGTGQHPGMQHPKIFGGRSEPIVEWMQG
ncbi:hypothetical protein LCGC14_2871880, partial [marine sediment metagenome]